MDEPEVHQYRNDCARIGTEYLPVFPVAINRKQWHAALYAAK
jgi:hypothetical protein